MNVTAAADESSPHRLFLSFVWAFLIPLCRCAALRAVQLHLLTKFPEINPVENKAQMVWKERDLLHVVVQTNVNLSLSSAL